MLRNRYEDYKIPLGMPYKVLSAMAKARKSNEYVDFYFKFGNKHIGVHSVVLAVQSKVFNAIFSGLMKENSPVEINDIPYSIFHDLVCRMYGMETQLESIEDAMNLYYAAHKYEHRETEDFACSYLMANITEKNYYEVDAFAKLFDDKKLRMGCLSFVERNICQVLKEEPKLPDEFHFTNLHLVNKQDCFHATISQYLGSIHALSYGIQEATKIISTKSSVLKLVLNDNYFTMWNGKSILAPGCKNFYEPFVELSGVLETSEEFLMIFQSQMNEGFIFQIEDEAYPDGKCLVVHKKILEKQTKMCKDFLKNTLQMEIKRVSFTGFKSMIENMYGEGSYLNSPKDVMEFYEASKIIQYKHGIEESKKALSYFVNDETVEDIFKFIKAQEDKSFLMKCFEKYGDTLEAIIKSIFKNDFTFCEMWRFYVQEQNELITAIEIDLNDIKEKISIDKNATGAFSMIKLLLRKLQDVILELSDNFHLTYTFELFANNEDYYSSDEDYSMDY